MFADQKALTVEDLKAKAETVGLDRAAFDECLDSGRYQEAVDEDLREGTVVGVSGTPALFVNGRMLSGAVPYDSVAQVIDEELERE
jgi:protein-disulfide isomerase